MAAPTKTAAVIASGVLALGAGLGIATTAYANPIPMPNPSSAPTEVPAPQTEPPVVPDNPGGPLPQTEPPAVPNNPEGPTGQDPMGEEALVQELSRMLGVDEETVRAGLQELRATYGPQLAAAVKAQLDAAVQNGTLTQEEADAIQKAIERGLTTTGTR